MVFAPFGRAVRGNVKAAHAALGGVAVRPELPVPQRLPALPESLERQGETLKSWRFVTLDTNKLT